MDLDLFALQAEDSAWQQRSQSRRPTLVYHRPLAHLHSRICIV